MGQADETSGAAAPRCLTTDKGRGARRRFRCRSHPAEAIPGTHFEQRVAETGFSRFPVVADDGRPVG
ncbi:hypothetical protein GCM10027261_32520 [Geodermatophilus arenarius]